MARFSCTCGHITHLSTDALPCEASAYVLRDQNANEMWEAVYQDLTAFAAALAENQREAWIREQFGEGYPRDLTDREVLEDALSRHFSQRSLAMFQCESCGRLWVQEEPYTDRYRPFQPEGEWRDTLAVHKMAPSPGRDQE